MGSEMCIRDRVEPRPRRLTPCAVGLAAMDEVRRKSEKPGTSRRRSFRVMPAARFPSRPARTVTAAGAVGGTPFGASVGGGLFYHPPAPARDRIDAHGGR